MNRAGVRVIAPSLRCRRRRIGIALCGVLATLTTAPLLAQQAPDVETMLRADLDGRSAMAWEAGRPLAWADFAGQPPKSATWAALSFTGMRYIYRCGEHQVQFGVVAYFEPPQSWVKPGTARNRHSSAQVLPHEQGHFDIAEISARLLREQLTALAVPCAELEAAFTAAGNAAVARAEALQNRYDNATAHGTFAPGQAQWHDWIATTLTALNAFADPWISREY